MPNNYPREINLDSDTEARLISYLNEELLNHYGERGPWVEDLKRFQTDYYAKPTTEKRTRPFPGAANIVIPLTAIAVEAIHSRVMTTMFALDQFVAIKLPDQYEDINHSIEKVTDYTLLRGVNIRRFANDACLELEKLGTGVGKSGYEVIERSAIKSIGEKEEEFTVTTYKGATADAVPLANFLMPFNCQDPQTARWVGEEHLEDTFHVKNLVDSGFFKEETWERLESYYTNSQNISGLSSDTYRQNTQKLQNQTPAWPKDLGWQEIWLSFNVDGNEDGKTHEIVVHYHRLAQFIMSCRYNWYDDLHRPYRYGNWFPLEHRWAGIGICKQNEQFQREVTTQHRQRLDNATLANMRMIKVSKLSGYGPGEPVFPGKIWLVDSKDDIESFQLGEIYPSAYNNEQQTLNYSQQRLGINELNQGMPQAGTPGTASSDIARLAESSKKFDYSYGLNIKPFIAQVCLDVMCNEAQFGFRDVRIFDTLPFDQKDKVIAFYQQPISLLRSSINMDLKLVGQNQNKIQDRASWTQLAGFTTQYYTGILQLAAQVNPQMVPMIAQAAMSAATEAFKQILETFDVRNIDRILLKQLLAPIQVAQINAQSNQLPPAGADQGSTTPSQESGVGNTSSVTPPS